IMVQPLCSSLIWIMGRIKGPVNKKRLVLSMVNDLLYFFYHQIGKMLAVVIDLFRVSVQVVLVGTVPIKSVGIINDTSPLMPKEIIEPLSVGQVLFPVPKVPFTDEGGIVAIGLEHLGH